ncbi:MAG: HAD-IA family hydrolase [Gammaproteobacteria bacterium]|nr:HAD-IA family hydrolase [Gammaproteobacteria bacterium]
MHCAIATSTSTSNVETLMHHVLNRPLADYFEAVVTSDIVVDKKPSPAVYQFAMAELGLAPDECVAIEDTASGNRAALAAGLKTVITTHRFTRHHDFTGASLILDELGSPRQPFTVQKGDAHGARFVDIALLDALLTGTYEPHTEQDWPQPELVAMAK